MHAWWQPPVAALLLGLLAAVIWPLVMRVALPVAFFTFGLGGFLLLGAAVLALFHAIPGVESRGFGTAVVVALAMAARRRGDQQRAGHRRGRGLLPPRPPPHRRGGAGRRARPRRPACCSCRSTAWVTTSPAAPSGTARCPPWPPGCAPAATCCTGWHTDWSSQTGAAVLRHPARLQPRRRRLPLVRQGPRPRRPACPRPRTPPSIERRHSDGRGLLRRRRRRPRQPVHRRRRRTSP